MSFLSLNRHVLPIVIFRVFSYLVCNALCTRFYIGPPRILGETQSVVGPLGKTARFVCKTDGIPPPTIKWMKDGRVVDASGRIRQKMNPNNELVIMQTITADSGFYQCMAENSVGYASVAVLLQVSTSHSQPDPPSNLQAITRSNTSIELSWDAPKSRNGLHIQAYTVHYYKSGKKTQGF